jgi:hypothetical protein
MKVGDLTLAAIVPALLLCSCYTVLNAPYSTTSGYDESRYAKDEVYPQVGRFDDREDGYRDPYGSYGPGAYGQPAYPVFGYDSRYGGFGGYGGGYGYNPYSSGYGPHGYGYDPYYSNSSVGGGYIPPGYELVTIQELDRLRASNSASTQIPTPGLDPAELHLLQLEKAQNAWSSRVNSIERQKKPQPTRRAPAAVSSSSAKSTSTSSSAEDKKPSAKAKAKSRQKRR